MIQQINRLKSKQAADSKPEENAATTEDVLLLREIRDSLKNKG
jgi:large conductance mechanosensitive channel